MKVVVVGGGRPRARARPTSLARTADVVVTPGNPGIAAGIACTDAPLEELDADLVVVGPEAPLVDGLADRLRAAGRAGVRPRRRRRPARGVEGLDEGGRGRRRRAHRRATAAFTEVEPALDVPARRCRRPWVVKTDGLAAGKGVLVTDSLIEAEDDVRGQAGRDELRRRRPHRRDRGGHDRPRAVDPRRVRRPPGRGPGPGPGLQAGRRRRRRARTPAAWARTRRCPRRPTTRGRRRARPVRRADARRAAPARASTTAARSTPA